MPVVDREDSLAASGGATANAGGAATALFINQPTISALKHYKLEGSSVERLMTFLTALGSDIEIHTAICHLIPPLPVC